jgi:hypothetical protein
MNWFLIILNYTLKGMRKEILSDRQKELLPFLKKFKKNYYLVGGTAIALHIGHRRSIDFDLFTYLPINKRKISSEIQKLNLQGVNWLPKKISTNP